MYAKKLSDIAFNIVQALNFFLINVIYLNILMVKSELGVLIYKTFNARYNRFSPLLPTVAIIYFSFYTSKYSK